MKVEDGRSSPSGIVLADGGWGLEGVGRFGAVLAGLKKFACGVNGWLSGMNFTVRIPPAHALAMEHRSPPAK